MNVLITGACGFLGHQTVERLQAYNQTANAPIKIIATDVKAKSNFPLDQHTVYDKIDVRAKEMMTVFAREKIDIVIHLATIVTPGKKTSPELQYAVDVQGTENILQACLEHDVKKIIVTSSGAAYGYHKDHPDWLTEDHAIRGNKNFHYAYHKRRVEEILAEYREKHPHLQQVIFRIGTILGEDVGNQITNLFQMKRIIGVAGSDSPFVFIWDQDVISCIVAAVLREVTGVYNVAGDGVVTIDEIAGILNKKVVRLPSWFLKMVLFVLKRLYLTQYGEEQVNFLKYRPVLDNHKLKTKFGFTPSYSSKEIFVKIAQQKSEWHHP